MRSPAVKRLLLAAALAAFPLPALAQQHVEVASVAPRAEDVGSLDGIIRAFYDVVSGPAGEARQWSRDRTLYIPEVRFVSMDVGKDGKVHANVMTHQQFVDRANGGMVKQGFFETEIHRVTRSFGNVTHVFSTYEMRQKPEAPVFGRGVNSIQLFNDGTRWWILSVAWDDEREGNAIPREMLP
ncbi:MAG TPA: hypothetical protein VLD58_08455 [Gemmatimonadales bacterium]|nr:hypothetical protein [Gemmatimonadales bacterium]